MKKLNYDINLLYAYKNGDDLGEYTEEMLENNALFMTDLISVWKDKRVFDYASNDVKNNVNFLVAVIKAFKSDENYVRSIYNNYVNNNPDKTDTLIIYLYNMFRKDNTLFASEIKDSAEKLFMSMDIDGTFELVYKKYHKSDSKLKFMARFYVNNIFYSNSDITFEEIAIMAKNKTKPYYFVTKFIRKYDKALYDYVLKYKDVVDDIIENLKKTISKISDKEKDDKNKVDTANRIIFILFNYMKNNKIKDADLTTLLSYLIYKFNLQDMFSTYDAASNSKPGFRYADYKDKYKTYEDSLKSIDLSELEEKIANCVK